MPSFDKTKSCLGFIYGNRDFFPDQLVTEARTDLARFCGQTGLRAIQLGEQDSKLGGVETLANARKCAELFKRHADELDGIVVVLPNFGDEKGVTEVLKLSGLKLPVLIQAYPDVILILAHLRWGAIPRAERYANVFLDTTYVDPRT